jgi:thiamine pyrophosphate-dependent acetolactate synthase large subunit-like protein
MKAKDAITLLSKNRGDAVVVCALGTASSQWWSATKSEDTLYMLGGMGFSASVALGLAVSIPDTPVWVLNSDGSLCMNLNCLLTESEQAPRNLKHFLIDNQVYQTLDAPMPMVNQGRTDYAAVARAVGIPHAVNIDNLADLERMLPEIIATPGPYFTSLKVEAQSDYFKVPPAPYEGPEMKYRFGRAMEKKLGITVFGPRGY